MQALDRAEAPAVNRPLQLQQDQQAAGGGNPQGFRKGLELLSPAAELIQHEGQDRHVNGLRSHRQVGDRPDHLATAYTPQLRLLDRSSCGQHRRGEVQLCHLQPLEEVLRG